MVHETNFPIREKPISKVIIIIFNLISTYTRLHFADNEEISRHGTETTYTNFYKTANRRFSKKAVSVRFYFENEKEDFTETKTKIIFA